jgi:hypothetical protein
MTRQLSEPAPDTAQGTSRAGRRLGILLVALGIGLMVNTLLGPLVFGIVDYPLSETLRNQTIGLEAVSLLLVGPMSIAAGVLARREHPVVPYAGVVVGSYSAYMFVQYVVGPSYLDYPRVLPLQIGLFILAWVVVQQSWTACGRSDALLLPGHRYRRHAYVLFAFAGFVLLRYAPAVPGTVANDAIPAESVQDPAMFWTIVLMDLGIFVPVALTAGVALLRDGAAWARRLLFVATGWFVLVTTAVTAMAITMVVNDDPHAAPGQMLVFVVTVLLVIGYGARLYRPFFAPDR